MFEDAKVDRLLVRLDGIGDRVVWFRVDPTDKVVLKGVSSAAQNAAAVRTRLCISISSIPGAIVSNL